jgi:polyhydroxyalkanoate synthase
MNSDSDWAKGAQQFQQLLGDSWGKALQSFQGLDLGAAPGAVQAPSISFSPAKLQALQQQYLKDAAALWNQSLQATPPAGDKRFAAEAWGSNPVAAFTAAAYLLNARTLMGLADAVEADAKTKARIRFAVEQWMAASSPSNFLALNAEAQKKAIETKGESIAKGVQNLLHDMRQGHVSMTDESVFEVGKNVATTEGAVVFENELFQLIEYKPLTAKVYERPFLLVPPCINKFYILDLQPENSLIRYAVAQGHRTFVVSWRNPDESLAQTTWDDYIENAAIKAIDVVQDITGAKQINALGFCVGGTILGTALAVLAARGQKPVASATFLTTFLDFSTPACSTCSLTKPSSSSARCSSARAASSRGRTSPPPSASCGRTTWCGTTWWATTSRAKPRRRLTCCTGTATAPTCRAPCTPGTSATPTSRTTSSSPASALWRAKRSTCASWTFRCTSMAAAKTTSCRLAAPTRPPSTCQARSAL